jgi:hypothetical protein
MRLQAFHCPSCGAPLDLASHPAHVTCTYCSASLIIDGARVSGHRPLPPTDPDQGAREPFPEPDVTLSTWQAPRFELSFLEQPVDSAPPQVFACFELPDARFAMVWLRVVDQQRLARTDVPLDEAFAALRTSLTDDLDPGLAANVALETLCRERFDHRLECAVLLFEPRRMRVVPYLAGCPDALVWASSEHGQATVPSLRHQALERKNLREAADHFSNGEPVRLAADDLVVFASAGYLHRGGKGYGEGTRALLDTLNSHLGEAPLRIVTLAKNAFWDAYQTQHQRKNVGPLVGPVQVAAVRAILPPRASSVPSGFTIVTERSRRFELAALVRAGDAHRLLPLHDDRQAFVLLGTADGSPLPDGALDTVCAAVAKVLDRPNHGDNENPRQAGRDALAALGLASARLHVVQCFDRYERVKYFDRGWKNAVALGSRGVKGDSQQQFDGGGEATVHAGSRLFFPGAATWQGELGTADALADEWNGGRASRLYEALTVHWKTRKTVPALELLARAALADEPQLDLSGLVLVTGVEPA